MQWALIWIYWGLLLVMTAGVTVKGSGPMRRTVWTIAIVCVAQFIVAQWVVNPQSVSHAVFMFCVDALACRVITWQPAGKWQSLIGFSYIIQLGMHIGRLAANNPDMNFYWNGLTIMAFLQIILVGGWWASERGLFRNRRRRHPPAYEAHREGVDG